MKFTTALFALIPLIYALPAPEGDLGALSARTQGNVRVCVDAGFTGDCTTLHGSSGECVNVPLVFNDNISSVGPDPGQDCFFFMQANCGGSSLGPIRVPGIPNLNIDADVAFNDAISSFS
ncbi:hypothetical protein DFH08DRAFT_960605 [Mycena albidolilacea]|uniref:Uncharacterized protein n=1 Tax=Mycena albidolilacea TaxID=1033008 RepID=A0AAD7A0U3_9AGAR|nr:hypothetical protein DFH08DRAFT_960605 [Mycena albidolilacea]